MNSEVRFLILIAALALLFIGCNAPSNNTIERTEVFDLEAYLVDFQKKNPTLSSVDFIDEKKTDTTYYEEYPTDQMVDLMTQFAFSRKQRSGDFSDTSYEMKNMACLRWEPLPNEENQSLTVCYQGDMIHEMAAQKSKNTLLNRLGESFAFRPKSGFRLNSHFVDKIGGDSLIVEMQLRWRADEEN